MPIALTATNSSANRTSVAGSSGALDMALAAVVATPAAAITALQHVDGASRDAFRQLVALHGRTPATTPSVAGLLKAVRRGLKTASTRPGLSGAQRALTLDTVATVDRVLALHARAASDLERKAQAPREATVSRPERPTPHVTSDGRAADASRPAAKRAPGDHRRRILRIVVVDLRRVWKSRKRPTPAPHHECWREP